MSQKHYIIKGTLFLTFMGGITRIAGFFYKIFLSRTIGASEIGLYQLAVPVFTFCMALCGGGIQTAISRFVAAFCAKEDLRSARKTVITGLFFSLSLSVLCSVILYKNADFIAIRFLLEPSCAELLRIMAFSLPFSMIHGCISGYCMGRKNVLLPALSQFIEQLARILSAVLIYLSAKGNGQPIGAGLMAIGQLAGEIVSTLYCIIWLSVSQHLLFHQANHQRVHRHKYPDRQISTSVRQPGMLRQLLSVSFPLSLNRMLMCILQTIEAALLPQMLQSCGHTSTEALSVYGTLTGMAMPMILFPTAATSSLGMLLLPTVSEAQALQKKKQISDTIHAAYLGGMILGSFCLGAFFLFGQNIGNIIFHSALAGSLLRQMAFLCPLIYINTTMTSILHGLGYSGYLLIWNVAGYLLRLFAIVNLVPSFGIVGYVCGLILDHLILTICMTFTLRKKGLLQVSIGTAVNRG